MDNSEFKSGARYFSNVENVLKSIKNIQSTIHKPGVRSSDEYPLANSFNLSSNNEKLLINMVKGLASIIDTQNDILKYIVSHDSKAIIDESSEAVTPGQFFILKTLETIVVVKERINKDNVKVHIISKSIDKIVNIKDLE